MRIQEMRSGLSHLRKRVSAEDVENSTDAGEKSPSQNGGGPDVEVTSDLEQALWSVVSFSEVEAGGLTYAQAAALTSQLDESGIPGLCIITDTAARKTLPT